MNVDHTLIHCPVLSRYFVPLRLSMIGARYILSAQENLTVNDVEMKEEKARAMRTTMIMYSKLV
jgi:hypothetical protein